MSATQSSVEWLLAQTGALKRIRDQSNSREFEFTVTLYVECDRVEHVAALKHDPGQVGGLVPHTVWLGEMDITKAFNAEMMDRLADAANGADE